MSFYPVNIARCQHIKVNGVQCGSPALHRRRFCFFHQQWRQQHVAQDSQLTAQRAQAFNLPLLEDANSVQLALMQVMRLILTGQIDAKSAGLLLYALQTASLNLKRTEFEPLTRHKVVIQPNQVKDTPLDAYAWQPRDFVEVEEEEEEENDEEPADDDETEDQPEPDPGDAELGKEKLNQKGELTGEDASKTPWWLKKPSQGVRIPVADVLRITGSSKDIEDDPSDADP